MNTQWNGVKYKVKQNKKYSLAHVWKMEKATAVGSGVDFGGFDSSAKLNK
tara:strand:- start:742 stop:891 length:150 start_codon:yes stop_codon:yes gene_type:complete